MSFEEDFNKGMDVVRELLGDNAPNKVIAIPYQIAEVGKRRYELERIPKTR